MSLQDPNVVNPRKRKRVAIVIGNPATSTTTGWPVGFWWSELTHSYFVLSEKGYEIEVFSQDGGRCEADSMSDPRDPSGYSSSDLITMGFIHTPQLAALTEKTRKAAEMDVDRFDAIIVAGGQSPMFTFERAADLQRTFVKFYEQGKVAVALCHGVAILRVRRAVEWRAAGQRQDRDGLCERRGRLCGQRRVGPEPASSQPARHAMEDRGRDEAPRRKLRAGGAVAAVRDSRWQPHHGSAEFFG